MLQIQQLLRQHVPLRGGGLQTAVQLLDQLVVVLGLGLQALQRALLLAHLRGVLQHRHLVPQRLQLLLVSLRVLRRLLSGLLQVLLQNGDFALELALRFRGRLSRWGKEDTVDALDEELHQ